jgi:signal transduction histidine kinase
MARPLELTPAEVDLVALARRVAERHDQMSTLHRIRVEAPEQLTSNFDGARLERVLDNLVSNAVKFSPAGGEVVISLAIEEQQAVLRVSDEGIGVPPDEVDKVFGRFERGSNAVHRGIVGTGIGLAYVREVVTAHGGAVQVDSRQDVGSVFTIRLPLASAVPKTSAGAAEARVEEHVELG